MNSHFIHPYMIIVCLITACSPLSTQKHQNEPVSRHGNPPFYRVAGKQYFTLKKSENYQAEGIASWYGDEFHGKRTANGEIFDRNGYSAAHKTLPLPCMVEVTNLENQQRLIIRVNDRGPFHGDRLIDLSYAAAKKLGFAAKGIAKVRVRALPMTRQSKASFTYIQIGAFRQQNTANQTKQQFLEDGFSHPVRISSDQEWFRLQVGPLKNLQEINDAVEKIKQKGISGWFFVAN